mgnify:CR=1 FL=1
MEAVCVFQEVSLEKSEPWLISLAVLEITVSVLKAHLLADCRFFPEIEFHEHGDCADFRGDGFVEPSLLSRLFQLCVRREKASIGIIGWHWLSERQLGDLVGFPAIRVNAIFVARPGFNSTNQAGDQFLETRAKMFTVREMRQ